LLNTCPCQACATARKYIEADGFELYMSPSFANNSDGKRQLQAREIPTAYCSLSTQWACERNSPPATDALLSPPSSQPAR